MSIPNKLEKLILASIENQTIKSGETFKNNADLFRRIGFIEEDDKRPTGNKSYKFNKVLSGFVDISKTGNGNEIQINIKPEDEYVFQSEKSTNLRFEGNKNYMNIIKYLYDFTDGKPYFIGNWQTLYKTMSAFYRLCKHQIKQEEDGSISMASGPFAGIDGKLLSFFMNELKNQVFRKYRKRLKTLEKHHFITTEKVFIEAQLDPFVIYINGSEGYKLAESIKKEVLINMLLLEEREVYIYNRQDEYFKEFANYYKYFSTYEIYVFKKLSEDEAALSKMASSDDFLEEHFFYSFTSKEFENIVNASPEERINLLKERFESLSQPDYLSNEITNNKDSIQSDMALLCSPGRENRVYSSIIIHFNRFTVEDDPYSTDDSYNQSILLENILAFEKQMIETLIPVIEEFDYKKELSSEEKIFIKAINHFDDTTCNETDNVQASESDCLEKYYEQEKTKLIALLKSYLDNPNKLLDCFKGVSIGFNPEYILPEDKDAFEKGIQDRIDDMVNHEYQSILENIDKSLDLYNQKGEDDNDLSIDNNTVNNSSSVCNHKGIYVA